MLTTSSVSGKLSGCLKNAGFTLWSGILKWPVILKTFYLQLLRLSLFLKAVMMNYWQQSTLMIENG